jgi:hypothetical protein
MTFFNLALSRYSCWRKKKTVLSCQCEWRDKIFHMEIAVQQGGSCHANVYGAIT